MTLNQQRRQKKLAKKASKAKKENRLRARRKQEMTSLAGRMRWAGRFPIEFCQVSQDLLSPPGLGMVTLARKLPNGQLAVAQVLVDAGCLGVKDATGLMIDQKTLAEKTDHLDFIRHSPEDGLALILQAIDYAKELGFSPHPDFAKVLPLFVGIDAGRSRAMLQCGGTTGKPFYANGPFEDMARQKVVINQLTHSVGPGNFDYICMVGDVDGASRFELIGEEDFGETDGWDDNVLDGHIA